MAAGYGIGTAPLGTQYVARFFKAKLIGFGVESGFGTLVVEMGVLGLILWLVMSTAIVVSAWKIVKKLKGSPWFPLAFVIFWYALVLLFALTFAGMQAYQDFLMNAYLWLLLGILFRLPTLSPSHNWRLPMRLAEATAALDALALRIAVVSPLWDRRQWQR
jgi:hypothetical protein